MFQNIKQIKNIKKKMSYGVSGSKIILIGEHSVVYGYPAISLPLKSIKVRCNLLKIENRNYNKGYKKLLFNDQDPLLKAFEMAFTYLGKNSEKYIKNMYYRIDSDIPSKRGMGSSAAVCIAAIKSVFHYFKKPINNNVLEKLVHESEKIAHINPSGLDVKTCLSKYPIKYSKNKEIRYIKMNLGVYLLILDTGITGKTKEAVQIVKEKYENIKGYIEKLGKLVESAEKNIKYKNIKALGIVLNKAHECLKYIGVSCKKSDKLVQISIENGAYGAKMTGGGLGGCVIALVPNKETAYRIINESKKYNVCNNWIEKI